MFERYGRLKSVTVPMDTVTNKNKGCVKERENKRVDMILTSDMIALPLLNLRIVVMLKTHLKNLMVSASKAVV
jgi:hypothetical protein